MMYVRSVLFIYGKKRAAAKNAHSFAAPFRTCQRTRATSAYGTYSLAFPSSAGLEVDEDTQFARYHKTSCKPKSFLTLTFPRIKNWPNPSATSLARPSISPSTVAILWVEGKGR